MKDIEQFIPHRSTMKLVDAILSANDYEITTQCHVTKNWPLHHEGAVDTMVLAEVIAQTAAAGIGWRERNLDTGNQGYLVGLKKCRFHARTIPVDSDLIAFVKVLRESDNYAVLEGNVRLGDDIIFEGQVQIVRKEEQEESL